MRILVVEDDDKIASFVIKGLKQSGFSVDHAGDGEAALAYCSDVSYDAIVLDIMLPRSDGLSVLRRIRSERRLIPVILLSAKARVEDRVAGLHSGADDYLTKPFAFAELVVRVKSLLRRPPVNPTHVLRIADLELDRLTQQVRRAGKRIELTSKEYALLEYLISHAGRVLTRTMIIEHVWDESFEGLTNIVDVYVRHLREKVDQGHERKLIRTVRYSGYCLADSEDEPA